jgi:phage baseplate assembly protein V
MAAMPAKSPRSDFNDADNERALNMSVRMGTLYEIDYEIIPPRARVKSGELITDFLPLLEEIGHNYRRWRPCRVGTQCLFASPSGDSRQGVIVGLFNTEAIPQPETDPGIDLILFEDGTRIQKDGEQLLVDSTVTVNVNAPDINATATNQITIKAPSITLDGDVTVTGGNLTKVGGSVTHDGTAIDKTHVHLIIVPVPSTPVTPPMLP